MVEDDGVQWAAYGEFLVFHIFTNPNGRVIKSDAFDPLYYGSKELTMKPKEVIHNRRLAMLINGADFTDWPSGTLPISHTAEDITATAEVFAQALHVLRQDGGF